MKRIALVDDDTAIHEIFEIAFGEKYEICSLVDGSAILKKEIEVPHLFTIDKQIPGVDGLELCRFIKTSDINKSVPVMILSASHHILEQGAEAGANFIIEKPFCLEHLSEQIALCIEEKREYLNPVAL